MPIAHREITKKHIKRIAEKAAEGCGGLPIDDDSADLVYPTVTVDEDYKTKGLYSCTFSAYLNDSGLKNYWDEHLKVGEGVETFYLSPPAITNGIFVFINESIYIPIVRYYKNSSGITETLTLKSETSSDGLIDKIVANDWSWSPDVYINIAFVEWNPLSASVNVNPPHEEDLRVKKIEGRPKEGFFYYDETNQVFTEYIP